jgi:hypothetical protein
MSKVALASLVLAAFVAGALLALSPTGSRVLPEAAAGPVWDADRSAYVTGDPKHLTFWTMKDGKVTEAVTYSITESFVSSGEGKPALPERVFVEERYTPRAPRSDGDR